MTKPQRPPSSSVPAPSECDHARPHRTGGWDVHGVYSQECDLCGADTTDEVEGAEAERFLRKLRGETVDH